MIETNPLKDKLEKEIVYKVFAANVPVALYTEQFEVVNSFCKQNFMDNRWSMIWNLVVDAMEDYKYKLLTDRIIELEAEVQSMKEQPKEPEKKKGLPTFGNREK